MLEDYGDGDTEHLAEPSAVCCLDAVRINDSKAVTVIVFDLNSVMDVVHRYIAIHDRVVGVERNLDGWMPCGSELGPFST
jgi:hypothetical protein